MTAPTHQKHRPDLWSQIGPAAANPTYQILDMKHRPDLQSVLGLLGLPAQADEILASVKKGDGDALALIQDSLKRPSIVDEHGIESSAALASSLALLDLGPGVEILRLIQHLIRSIVVEHEYIDADHRSCYARIYRFRHRDTPRRCNRLHLFAPVDGRPIRLEDLLADGDAWKAYRGNIVIRPLSHQKLGRTFLSVDLAPRPEHGSRFITCAHKGRSNLFGHYINYDAVPWMQQDHIVARCATAAIWTAAWHLSHKLAHEVRTFTTPEITDLATRYSHSSGRAMPSSGLHTQQVIDALQAMGFECQLYGEYGELTPD
jgi:hypothetical protein